MFDTSSGNPQKLSATNLHLTLVLLGDIIIKVTSEQAFIKTSGFYESD
ncbi:MAG: hypothetical protein RMY33_019400 [Nostoc sp. DedQUE03]|nr:hypothetical protein [Nostoc sp. DedQUE02]